MKKANTYVLLFLCIILLGGFLRLANLEPRPMHTDEAVNSVKFGRLLEQGNYTYDRVEYHGPIIHYLALIPAWLTGTRLFADLNEKHLRIVPAIAGFGLLLLLFGLKDIAGWKPVLATVFIGAISPAMVFYSRYFIHEMLLVFFTYGFIISIFLFFKRKRLILLIWSAVFLGLMHTTKETSILSLGILFLAVICEHFLYRNSSFLSGDMIQSLKWYHYILFIGIAGLISILLFSSFFKNPQGIVDSVTTYKSYFLKAGKNETHNHPWYYYLQILIWNRGPGLLIWSELPVLILSFIGIYMVSIKRRIDEADQFFRLIAIFSILLLIVYSIIPYKTPWSMLSFYFGLILMAGYGMTGLFEKFRKSWFRVVLWIITLIGTAYLIAQVLYTNYIYPAHPSNPYVYGHTSRDVFSIMDKIEEVATFHLDGKDIYIQVVSSDHDYWPLPWYLRKFTNVGWWDQVDFDTPLAPLIVVSPDQEESIITKMYTLPKPGEKYLYIPLFEEGTKLRPGIEIHAYVRKDYRDF